MFVTITEVNKNASRLNKEKFIISFIFTLFTHTHTHTHTLSYTEIDENIHTLGIFKALMSASGRQAGCFFFLSQFICLCIFEHLNALVDCTFFIKFYILIFVQFNCVHNMTKPIKCLAGNFQAKRHCAQVNFLQLKTLSLYGFKLRIISGLTEKR